MNCPQCGDVCHCSSEALPPPASLGPPGDLDGMDTPAWRDELTAKLDRYRSRRKVRPPRYPSLNLRFEPFESKALNSTSSPVPVANFEPISNHALALDGVTQQPDAVTEVEFRPPFVADLWTTAPPSPNAAAPSANLTSSARAVGKIIEFPRFAWAPPAPPPDQLAEPVMDRPRILDVPELEPPPPALGGITIEALKDEQPAKQPGIDVPLQNGPLGLRIVAGIVDGLIIGAASALFGCIFWKITAFRPPTVQLAGLGAGIPFLFWAAYQYLLLVYAATTPGLRLAGLQLCRFDGSSTGRSLRRWRVLAAWLSAVSLGMGYAWVLLDEENLCWHDRITRTYFGPKNR